MIDPNPYAAGPALAADTGSPPPAGTAAPARGGEPAAVRLPGPTFDNRFARLPDGFFARAQPAPLPAPVANHSRAAPTAVLRSSSREFLCSEAMHGLGIPTTRALAIVASDLPVFRETVETAAVVTRMSPSFLRFGSFEYFRHFDQPERLRMLGETLLDQLYPGLRQAPNPWLTLLGEITRRTARLVAAWQSVGFCNPKYVLRNHLAELAIRQARERDHGMVGRLLQALQRPYDEQPENEDLAALPPDWAAQLEVSCSS